MEVQDGYNLLHGSRSALEKVLRLAIVIERLNRVLEGVWMSREAGDALPQQALRFYHRLDKKYLSLPAEVVEAHIAALEPRIGGNVRFILQLTRIVNGANELAKLPGHEVDLAEFVNELYRDSTLFVGLRVLLYKLGKVSHRLQLDISRSNIESRLRQMEVHEQRHRDRAHREIRNMQRDITALIANPSTDESMRSMLETTYMELGQALEHIDNGGDLSEVPVLVESIELGPEPMSCAEFTEQVNATRASQDTSANEEPSLVPTSEPEAPVRETPGFWKTLKIWLFTPMKVSWSDIRNSRKKK